MYSHTHHTSPHSHGFNRGDVIDPEEEELQRQIDYETDANTEYNASRLSLSFRPRSISQEKNKSSKPRSKNKDKTKKKADVDQARRAARRLSGLDSDTTQGEDSSGLDRYVPKRRSKVTLGAVNPDGSKHAHKPTSRRSVPKMHLAQAHPSTPTNLPGQPSGYSYAAYSPADVPSPHGPPGAPNPYAPPINPYGAQMSQYAPNLYGHPPHYPGVFAGPNPNMPPNHSSHHGSLSTQERRHAAEQAARAILRSNPLPQLPGQAKPKSRNSGRPPSFGEVIVDSGVRGAEEGGLPGGYGHWHATSKQEKSKSKDGRSRSASTGMLPVQMANAHHPSQIHTRPPGMSEFPTNAASSKLSKDRGRSKERDRSARKERSRSRPAEQDPAANLGPPLKRVSSRTKWENRIAGMFGRNRKGSNVAQPEAEEAMYRQGYPHIPPSYHPAVDQGPASAPPTKSRFLPFGLGRPRRPSQPQLSTVPSAPEFRRTQTSYEPLHPRVGASLDVGLPPGQVSVGIPIDRFGRITLHTPEKTNEKDRVKNLKLGHRHGNEQIEGPVRIDARTSVHRSHDHGRSPREGNRPSLEDGRRPSFDASHRPDAPRQRSTSNTSQPQIVSRTSGGVPGSGGVHVQQRVDAYGSSAGTYSYTISQTHSGHRPDSHRRDIGVAPGVHVDRHGRIIIEPPGKANSGQDRVRSLKLGGRGGNEMLEGPTRVDIRGIGVR